LVGVRDKYLFLINSFSVSAVDIFNKLLNDNVYAGVFGDSVKRAGLI